MNMQYPLILITGASGWLGSRFVEILSGSIDGFGHPSLVPRVPVRVLVQTEEEARRLAEAYGIECVVGDICDAKSMERFCAGAGGGLLYHLAGVIHPRRMREFRHVNVLGTAHVLEAARNAGVRKIVAMSSNSVCGTNPTPEHVFTEQSPYSPYMGYGRSKQAMEELCKKYVRMYDTDITIARTCWFYGPHQPARQNTFFTMVRTGRFPLLGGTNRRSLSYVDNTCEGLLRIAQKPTKGNIYWLADERPYPMHEIIETVARVLRRDFGMQVSEKTLRLPKLLGTGAMFADRALQRAGVYQRELHVLGEMDKTIACSVEAAKRDLGYNPTVSLEEGMRRSVAWCLKHGHTL